MELIHSKYQQQLPRPGDIVFCLNGFDMGLFGVIEGNRNRQLDEVSICYQANAHNDGTVISCSGGPCYQCVPIGELIPTDYLMTYRYWRFKDGIMMAHNGENFTESNRLWCITKNDEEAKLTHYGRYDSIEHYMEHRQQCENWLNADRGEVARLKASLSDVEDGFVLQRGRHIEGKYKTEWFESKPVDQSHAYVIYNALSTMEYLRVTSWEKQHSGDYTCSIKTIKHGGICFRTMEEMSDFIAAYNLEPCGKGTWDCDLYRPNFEPHKLEIKPSTAFASLIDSDNC